MNPPTLPDYIKPGAVVRVKENDYKYRIYATDCGNTHYVHGAFFVREAWRIAAVDPERIVGPWIDKPDCTKLWPLLPPWIKYLAMDSEGKWYGFTGMPHTIVTKWVCTQHTEEQGTTWLYIPKDYAPIYSGDWKDSLVERPQ